MRMNEKLLIEKLLFPPFFRGKWQNPDIVLVHYLNVPYPDDAKLLVVASVSLWAERKEWSKDELISQLRPMCKLPFSNIKNSFLDNWVFSPFFFLFLNSFEPRWTEFKQRAGSFRKLWQVMDGRSWNSFSIPFLFSFLSLSGCFHSGFLVRWMAAVLKGGVGRI